MASSLPTNLDINRTDQSDFYLPTPQDLSTKSARTVENLSRPGAVVLPF
jgi:hypothetical protein